MYINLSEERTVWHKVLLCPVLILMFPVYIVCTALCIGLYASIIQVSYYWSLNLKRFVGWVHEC